MKILLALFIAVIPFSLSAEADLRPEPLYETLLGATPAELYAMFGAPQSVRTVRGPEAWQDDVVFIMQNDVDFYFCENRVWQIRLGDDADGNCRSLRPGAAVPQDGNGLHLISQTEQETIFELDKTSYPVRLSVWTDASGIITEMYIYRADY